MLLQQIIHQLDGELVRLQSLRGIVAGLSKSAAIVRSLEPKIDKLLKAEVKVPEPPARRGRPRKNVEAPVPAPSKLRVPRMPRLGRSTEPTALAKFTPAGPVVVSAAALAKERETRVSAKAAAPKGHDADRKVEVRPEMFARQLAARWLTPATKS